MNNETRRKLQAHADSQDGNLACKVANRISTDTRVCLRVARARADNELGGILLDQLLNRDLVISEDMDRGSF